MTDRLSETQTGERVTGAKGPEHIKTEEQAQEAFDRSQQAVRKLALEKGPSPELAKAMSEELGNYMLLQQIRAYGKGGSEISQYRKEAAQDAAEAFELEDYAKGGVELSDDVRDAMESKVAETNSHLDQIANDPSDATITRLTGATDRLDIEMFRAKYNELETLRGGEAEQLADPRVATAERGELEVSPATEKFNRAVKHKEVEGALDRKEDERIYRDRKGIAIVIEVMGDLGMDEAEMATYANRLADQYDAIRASADTVHSDKPPQARGRWSENQLWERLQRDAVWQRIDEKIDKQGDKLAGRGGRISRNKVMSSFLKFAVETSRS